MTDNTIVQKLWNLCDVLRDDGINYSNYVTELVLLLFPKMVHEQTEAGIIQKHPLGLRKRRDLVTLAELRQDRSWWQQTTERQGPEKFPMVDCPDGLHHPISPRCDPDRRS